MPLYEYQCLPEGHRFEARHGINEAVTACQVCGGDVRRVIHPVGIVFKGSGFYATDSKASSNAKKPEKPAEKAPASTESGGNTSQKSGSSSEAAG